MKGGVNINKYYMIWESVMAVVRGVSLSYEGVVDEKVSDVTVWREYVGGDLRFSSFFFLFLFLSLSLSLFIFHFFYLSLLTKYGKVRRFLLDPPTMPEELFFEWSQKVEPRNFEALIAKFISDEMKLAKV
jgi:hypothetical protein